MSRQSYNSYSTAPPSRHVSTSSTTTHSTSSAFSSSANPDEDWTKISDLAERRRIQNRIAQRNYRKKLKRRLEDLERRAGSSSASPPQTPAEIPQLTRPEHYKRSPEARPLQPSPRLLSTQQFTPPMHADDDGMFGHGFERDGSRTPPLFAYHAYPAPEEVMYPAYPTYRPVADWTRPEPEYLAPVTLPSMMQFHDTVKREYDELTPFGIAYAPVDANHHGYGQDPLTPPLSHSYDHSASCSDNGFQYPTTPLSMPASPRLMTQI